MRENIDDSDAWHEGNQQETALSWELEECSDIPVEEASYPVLVVTVAAAAFVAAVAAAVVKKMDDGRLWEFQWQ